MSPAETRELAHKLIDRIPHAQIAAVVGLLEVMVDPVDRAIANAPLEDELIGEDEERAVARSKEWLKHNRAIPNEQVLAEFGLTTEDFERMGRTPLEDTCPSQ
jgi:hypothetical protein